MGTAARRPIVQQAAAQFGRVESVNRLLTQYASGGARVAVLRDPRGLLTICSELLPNQRP
jgi:hypothetical protein